MPELSVIIVSYRTPDLLRRCLEQLFREPPGKSIEVLVVDNQSGDESANVARSFNQVRVIESGGNLGFAGGANLGLREATGNYFMIMNPDVEVHAGALDNLIDYMDVHQETGIVGPKLLNTDGSLQHSCRRRYTLKAILLRRTFLGKLFPNASELRRYLMLDFDHKTPRTVDWVAGAAMMVRRKAVDDVGPMEERYFLYFEDVDWCARMHARGWLVDYFPDAVMTHHWQRASWGFGPAARRHLRSGLKFYDRWGGLLFVLRQYGDSLRSLGLFALDLVAFFAALVTAYLVRQQLAPLIDRPMWPLSFYGGLFTGSIFVLAATFYQQGLYRRTLDGDWVDVAFRVAKAATLASFLLMAGTFIFKVRAYSRVIVFGSWPLVVLFSFAVRRIIDGVFTRARKDRWNLRRVALVGQEASLDRLENTMLQYPEMGWDPVRLRRSFRSELPEDQAMSVLVKQLRSERVSEVVMSMGSLGDSDQLTKRLLFLRKEGIGVRLIAPFLTSLSSRARLEFFKDVPWLTLDRSSLGSSKPSKRVLDLWVATALVILGGLPFLAVWAGRLAARKKVWEPEEGLVGRWGEIFTVRRLAGQGWSRSYPLLGKVLKGKMSLVGARPVAPGMENPGGDSWRRVRERFRPGLVGPWSLTPETTPEEEMQQELRYLENWSTERDLKLLTRVALARLGGGSDRGSPSPVSPEHSNPETSSAGDSWRTHSSKI